MKRKQFVRAIKYNNELSITNEIKIIITRDA